MSVKLIHPDWPLQDKVTAFTTTRKEGVSDAPYNECNLALHVGDIQSDVLSNRQQINDYLGRGIDIKWLKQTHSSIVLNATHIDADVNEADASFTMKKGVACAVLTADCLPILFSDANGECVGATHAGWRGLVGGVVENTIQAMSQHIKPSYAWLGPAIGPTAFEVGDDVYEIYVNRDVSFKTCFEAKKPGKWNLDIYQAAKIVLKQADIANIYGGSYCTYNDENRFFSYRRHSVTGRMATIITKR
ncbi:MAG: peptidoglycan editing factor PgeF [Gammaproteobacteria bacterium]